MNKADKVFVICVFLIAVLCYVPFVIQTVNTKGNSKEVVVNFKDQEVLRKDIQEDGVYTVDGILGNVDVEILDGAVRVEKETSPYHLCSVQGWVKDTGRPIICLPNQIVVEIIASEPSENGVDTVIQ